MSKDIRVKVIGKHPHSGESGYITVDERADGFVLSGTVHGMIRVVLANCPHGVDACFAFEKNLVLEDERR